MKISNADSYGFYLTKSTYVKEIDATLYDCTHKKSGARLLFLDRTDENTTFAIGFKTVPTDDTGVFHIMEHSVLCGSKKFPVKDPLTELLKGSVSTYLNALTSGDKTLYPVSSKNPKSFRGLVDVYLDAVFNPLVLENPFIFMQEGHRYELEEDGSLNVTGVVYNEMKGVYSTADEYADYLISKLASRGGTYSYDSGGNPDFIPQLSYADLVAAHDKFYHPSNSCIFLDGDVRTDEIFPLIDSYLSRFDSRECNFEITDGDDPITEVHEDLYPIEKEEDPTDKTRVYLCYNSYRHSERERLAALSLVAEVLSDLNTAPLTKIILDSGLCESFNIDFTRSYSLNALNVIFTGVKDGKERELIDVFDKALLGILNEGIPKDILTSSLKRREFNMRESDFGSHPAGMVYMRSCVEYAMLGEDPATPLKYEQLLTFLKDKLDTDFYEKTLLDIVSSPRSTLILRPDPTFNERKDNELKQRLKKELEAMSEEEKASIKEESRIFSEWQESEDSDEDLATIPTIAIEDLNIEPRKIPTEAVSLDGAEVVLHPLNTAGISYAELFFDVTDADEDELHYIRLFTDLVFEWDTKRGSITEFRKKTKSHLGAFYLTVSPTDRLDGARVYLRMCASCLESEREYAISIIEEYLYDTLYNDKEVLKKNLRQIYTYSIESIVSRGDSFAGMRSAARHSQYDTVSEHLYGYEYHVFVKELLESIDEKGEYVLKRFERIRDKYFKRERLTLGLTDRDGLGYAKSIVSVVREGGTASGECPIQLMKKCNEGIAIPSSVSFTSRAANLNENGKKDYSGAYRLLRNIASFEVLWNEIRLKNGAYDTGFYTRSSGPINAYSYRDPSPALSVEYFGKIADEIAALLDEEPDLLKYIIGVFGGYDMITTPRSDGSLATQKYLAGITHEETVARQKECLEATLDELKRLNVIIGEAMKLSTFTVVGPRDELEKIDGIDRILDI